MNHQKLLNYLATITETKFGTFLGESGGYISFRNSGQRGSIKEFTLSLASILQGIEDILRNHDSFQSHQSYVEQDWRDLGGEYFSDLALKSMITVQTKPTFTSFSKIICWANELEYVGDNDIPLAENYLSTTLTRLNDLIDAYKPRDLFEDTPRKNLDGIMPISKPFILLAGISGTGKTRFVRKQAQAHCDDNRNFCQIPVRPDWHEPSDLLGYISRISGTKYISTKALQFMIDAWRVVAPNANASGVGELDLSVPPYWLCLDEMNLAPVEQYFADYLSVLETREFKNGKYSCEPLLDKSILTIEGADIRADLGLKDNDGLWAYFLSHGIPLPPNLIVAGTVNMDETTHGFSRKVIDRALTIDFGEFFPNDYGKFFTKQDVPKLFTFSLLTQAAQDDLQTSVDPDGLKSVAFLNTVNKVLKQTPFELAYRALNELLLHVACFNPQNEASLQAVWDDFLMSKILPRIDGDEDKLRIVRESESENLFDVLLEVLESELDEIWPIEKTRTDLFREAHDGSEINNILCRSRKKLEWMKNRLEANTFTSFWP